MTNATPIRDTEAMRHAMVVSQLRPNAVNDPRVIAAMASVAREQFLPIELGALAYRDRPLPLGNGRAINQPEATGRLLTEARVRADDKVLLVGAAGGYAAALLSMLAASVVAVESDPALLVIARSALANAANLSLVETSLAEGAPSHAPYSLIVIDGAVEQVPQALVDQLAPGGRMVTGIVDRGVTRLALGTRTAGGFGLVDFVDVECVVLPGFARPVVFAF